MYARPFVVHCPKLMTMYVCDGMDDRMTCLGQLMFKKVYCYALITLINYKNQPNVHCSGCELVYSILCMSNCFRYSKSILYRC